MRHTTAVMRILVSPMVELKLDPGVTGRFKGYGSTFGNVDLGNDKCVKGCFERTLREHKANGTLPAMYWQHNRAEPVGDYLDMGEDAKGLYLEGQLWTGTKETECSRKSLNMMQGTSAKGLSMGYKTKVSEYDQKSGVRSLKDVDLMEVSIVGYGMNPKALVTDVKSETLSAVHIESVLRDAGMSAADVRALMQYGVKGLDKHNESNTQLINELLRFRAVLRGDEPCG